MSETEQNDSEIAETADKKAVKKAKKKISKTSGKPAVSSCGPWGSVAPSSAHRFWGSFRLRNNGCPA